MTIATITRDYRPLITVVYDEGVGQYRVEDCNSFSRGYPTDYRSACAERRAVLAETVAYKVLCLRHGESEAVCEAFRVGANFEAFRVRGARPERIAATIVKEAEAYLNAWRSRWLPA